MVIISEGEILRAHLEIRADLQTMVVLSQDLVLWELFDATDWEH